MKKFTKRALALVLAAIMLLAVTACGSNGDTTAPSDAANTPADSAADGETVTIKMIHYMGEQAKRDGLDKIIAAFEEANPGIKVEAQMVDSGQFVTMYKTKINANDAPDLFFGSPREMVEFIEGGHFMDITDAPFLEKVVPEVLEECEVNGKYYGVPIDVQIKGVFYNKDMFEQYGVEVPTTRDEFIALCDKFQSEGVIPFIHAYNFTWAPYQEMESFLVPMAKVMNNSTMWRDSQEGVANLSDNELAKQGFELFGKISSYRDEGDLGVDQPTAIQDFAAGKRPMFINGGWIMGDVIASNPEGNFGVFPAPWSNNPDENMMSVALDDAFIVSNTTQHKDEVFKFLDFMLSEEAANLWMENAKLMSSYVDANTDNADPFIQTVKSYIESGNIAPKAGLPDYTAEYSDAYVSLMESYVVRNDQDVTKLLQEFDDEMARIRG